MPSRLRRLQRKLPGWVKNESQGLKVEDPRDSDVVIPVMGQTGVGKSTIINRIAGKDVATVGHELQSCTASIQHVIVPHPTDEGRRIILVDTPGFDDTNVGDAEILRLIALWLARSYDDGMKVAGIIYLHEISQTRMFGTARKNLDMFRKLCGDDALKNVVLGTTKWGDVTPEVGQRRGQQLQDTYWKEMVQHGSVIMQVHADSASAWQIVNRILENEAVNFVLIQEEVIELQKVIPDTEAGRMLRYTLQELLEQQKKLSRDLEGEGAARRDDALLKQQLLENRERMGKTISQIQKLRIPLSARIKRLFGL